MKKLLFVFLLGAFAACGGNSGADSTDDASTVATDTTSGAMGGDTSSMMGSDTSTMGSDTGATSTPR